MAAARESTPPSHDALEAAAEWFAYLRDGQAGERGEAQWRTWLARSDENRRAWDYVQTVAERFAPLHAQGQREAAASALRGRGLSRRQVLGGLAALGITGTLGWAVHRHTPVPGMVAAWRADHRAGVGEVRQVALSDGSRLWLNTASAVNSHFGRRLRRLALVRGEILIDTAADPDRPLVVDTTHGRLRALGTRFTVREGDDHTLLAVHDGAVRVQPAGGAEPRTVNAGGQVRFDRHGIAAAGPADPARDAWSRGVLLARDITLGELVAELARYQRGHMGVAPSVADLRVFGSFPARRPDKALAMLEDLLPIRVKRPLPWWTTIEPAGG